VHDRLRATGVPDQPVAIAHYHCELAEAAIAERDSRARATTCGGRGKCSATSAAAQSCAATWHACRVTRSSRPSSIVVSCGAISTCSRWCCRRLAEAAKQAGTPEAFSDALADLVQNGLANRSEIAYAAIVSGYYDDPVILGCVREWLEADHDLKDITGALLQAGTEPTVDQLRAVAGAMRNVVLRHARYRCSECGLDSSSFLWQCPGCKSWDTCAASRRSSSCRGRLAPGPRRKVQKMGMSPTGTVPFFCTDFLREYAPFAPARAAGSVSSVDRSRPGRGREAKGVDHEEGPSHAHPGPHRHAAADRGVGRPR